jgi:hypothetical protein
VPISHQATYSSRPHEGCGRRRIRRHSVAGAHRTFAIPRPRNSGFKAVQERAIQFAKENAEAGFALANELTKAKDLQDVLRMQSSFAQKQMASYAKQAQELGRLMADATRSVLRAEPADPQRSKGVSSMRSPSLLAGFTMAAMLGVSLASKSVPALAGKRASKAYMQMDEIDRNADLSPKANTASAVRLLLKRLPTSRHRKRWRMRVRP